MLRRLFKRWYFLCTSEGSAIMGRRCLCAIPGVLAFLPVLAVAQMPNAPTPRLAFASATRHSTAATTATTYRPELSVVSAPISAVNGPRSISVDRNDGPSALALPGNSLELDGASDIPVAYAPGQSAEITLYSAGGLQQKLYDAFDNPDATASQDFGFALKAGGMKMRFMMGSGDVQLTSPKLMGMGKAAAMSEAAWSILSPGGHFGFRIQGRMLVDPSPAKYYPIVSTVNFYYVGKPAFSAFYRF